MSNVIEQSTGVHNVSTAPLPKLVDIQKMLEVVERDNGKSLSIENGWLHIGTRNYSNGLSENYIFGNAVGLFCHAFPDDVLQLWPRSCPRILRPLYRDMHHFPAVQGRFGLTDQEVTYLVGDVEDGGPDSTNEALERLRSFVQLEQEQIGWHRTEVGLRSIHQAAVDVAERAQNRREEEAEARRQFAEMCREGDRRD